MAKEKDLKDTNSKDQLLNEALKQIEKQYGKGAVMKLGDRALVEVDVISSGSLSIDNVLGPPKSLIYPLKSSIATTCFTSRIMLSLLRDAMNLP